MALSNHIQTLPESPLSENSNDKKSPPLLPRLAGLRERECSGGEITSNGKNYLRYIFLFMFFAINGEKVTVDGSSLGVT